MFRRRGLAIGLGLVLGLLVLLAPLPGPCWPAQAWTAPFRGTLPSRNEKLRQDSPPGATAKAVQEVAPPVGVQQLAEALRSRQPRLRILEPADGALLADGPWRLRLQVEDWPLVDGGELGLGPHLLVQIDDAPPLRSVETTLTLPPLTPGSHRLTVMAARPWGEVVKRPGSFQQIRLHRVSANPLSQPAPGTPQLLPTAPLDPAAGEPLLLDWLLIDAPLQNLRADDARWRLRISVNGDAFLVDQATPLWLRGWKAGSNAVLLELVDGRGEPLNPPFNSLVREVRIVSDAGRPVWMQRALTPAELALLLGQEAQIPLTPPGSGEEAPMLAPIKTDSAATEPGSAPESADRASSSEEDPADTGEQSSESADLTLLPADAAPPPGASDDEDAARRGLTIAPPQAEALHSGATDMASATGDMEAAGGAPETAAASSAERQAADSGATPAPPDTASAPAAAEQPPLPPPPPPAPPVDPPPDATGEAAAAAALPASRPAARDEVNPDGTLIRPPSKGMLQSLRQRLAR